MYIIVMSCAVDIAVKLFDMLHMLLLNPSVFQSHCDLHVIIRIDIPPSANR